MWEWENLRRVSLHACTFPCTHVRDFTCSMHMQTCVMNADAYRNNPLRAGTHCSRANVSFPRAASARVPCSCPPARARKPRARSESMRACQASECTESAEHRFDGRRSRGAWNVRAKASALVERALRACVTVAETDDCRTELGPACVAMVVARGTCALRRRTSRLSCARPGPHARKPRTRAREGIAPRVRCARALSPARGIRERALSPRERQASECTEPGVPSTDPTAAPVPRLFGAWKVRAKASAPCSACRGWIPRAHRVGQEFFLKHTFYGMCPGCVLQ
jgi:hypothetical protein